MAVLGRLKGGQGKDIKELKQLRARELNESERAKILDNALKTKDMDNELFLSKVKKRLDRYPLLSCVKCVAYFV